MCVGDVLFWWKGGKRILWTMMADWIRIGHLTLQVHTPCCLSHWNFPRLSLQSALLLFQKRTFLHPMFVGEIWSLHLLIKSPKSPWYSPDLLVTSPSPTRHALGPRRRRAGARVAGKGWAHGQTDARRFHLLEIEMQLAWGGKISYKGWIELSKPQNRSDWRGTIKHADLSINRRRFNMIAPTEILFWIDFTKHLAMAQNDSLTQHVTHVLSLEIFNEEWREIGHGSWISNMKCKFTLKRNLGRSLVQNESCPSK